jgi:hypothetical protein
MAKLVYLVQDLLFVSKIRETARQVGVEAESVSDPAQLPARARLAQLVIVDLRRPDAIAVLDSLPREVPKIGFVDHERVDVMDAARARGCRPYAKGKFSSELPHLLAALAS